MPARRRSRQRAIQVLYQWDVRKLPVEQCVRYYYETLFTEESPNETSIEKDGFMEALIHGAAESSEKIDALIEQHASNWRIERMPVVDRNILRMAVCEFLIEPTPPAVVIDEALELARRFSGEETVRFVNGVLDAIYHTLKRSNQSAFHQQQQKTVTAAASVGTPVSV
jgi:transcription antitermination protein NusB